MLMRENLDRNFSDADPRFRIPRNRLSRSRSRLRFLRTVLVLFSPCAVSFGQGSAPRSISLDEAIRAADALPDLKAAQAALRVAEAGVKLAGRWPDPSFSFATRSLTAKESYGLSLPLPWPGRGARLDVARAEAAVAGADRDLVRSTARRAMRLAWFTLATREDLAASASDRRIRARRTADAVTTLYDAGRVALIESSRVRADAALAGADASQADQDQRIAEGVLRRLLSIEAEQRLTVTDRKSVV